MSHFSLHKIDELKKGLGAHKGSGRGFPPTARNDLKAKFLLLGGENLTFISLVLVGIR